jgi:hypothetical protein
MCKIIPEQIACGIHTAVKRTHFGEVFFADPSLPAIRAFPYFNLLNKRQYPLHPWRYLRFHDCSPCRQALCAALKD